MSATKRIYGHIVDVVNHRLFDGAIVMDGDSIVALEPVGELPPHSPYLLPGFVDSHIHIESTLLLPENYAALAVSQGTVAAVTDPHEIANVMGIDGIDYMLDSAKKVHFHFSFGIPSGVPCTDHCETAGARISSLDVKHLLPREEFYGLAEMMNYPGILGGDPETCDKVRLTLEAGKVVDGHAPGLVGDDARRYVAAGISTDHEMYDLDQARERLSLGMKILMRDGSAARNFQSLMPLLANEDYRGKLMFCSDDLYPDEIAHGYINLMVARALHEGYDLWNVLEAACVAPVHHYSLNVGLLQPGHSADFIAVHDLQSMNVLATWVSGRKVFDKGDVDVLVEGSLHTKLCINNFHAVALDSESLVVEPQEGLLKVILAREQQLLTDQLTLSPLVLDGKVVCDTENDILKLVVYNRYQQAPPAVAFIRGFGLKRGALASTIAHDSHNIIAVGASDAELTLAINSLVRSKGGICVAEGQRVDLLELPVAGLMSLDNGLVVGEKHVLLKDRAHALGCPFHAPFMTLAFMALPVIPRLKLTDKGLFDVLDFAHTDLFCR